MQLGGGLKLVNLKKLLPGFSYVFSPWRFKQFSTAKGEESGKPAISYGCHTGCFAGNSGPPEFSPVRTG